MSLVHWQWIEMLEEKKYCVSIICVYVVNRNYKTGVVWWEKQKTFTRNQRNGESFFELEKKTT